MQRYSQFGQTATVDGITFTSGLPYLDLLYSGKWVWYTILPTENGRPDIVAYKWFSDYSLWPILAWVNSWSDPILACQAGETIMIPTDPINQQADIEPFTYAGTS